VPATATFGFLFADRALRIVHSAGRVEHWLLLGGLIGLGLYLLTLRAWAARAPHLSKSAALKIGAFSLLLMEAKRAMLPPPREQRGVIGTGPRTVQGEPVRCTVVARRRRGQ
jgi:hypothetical protein